MINIRYFLGLVYKLQHFEKEISIRATRSFGGAPGDAHWREEDGGWHFLVKAESWMQFGGLAFCFWIQWKYYSLIFDSLEQAFTIYSEGATCRLQSFLKSNFNKQLNTVGFKHCFMNSVWMSFIWISRNSVLKLNKDFLFWGLRSRNISI